MINNEFGLSQYSVMILQKPPVDTVPHSTSRGSRASSTCSTGSHKGKSSAHEKESKPKRKHRVVSFVIVPRLFTVCLHLSVYIKQLLSKVQYFSLASCIDNQF